MGKYVTSGGFKRPTLNEIKTQLEEGFRGVFGPSFDLNQDSPNGYLIAMLARTLGNVYELGQEVYDAHTTSGSTGSALDDILTLCSLKRLEASPTTGKVTLYSYDSSKSVVVPKGSRFSSSKGFGFTLDSEVVIGSAVNELKFFIGSPSSTSTPPYNFVLGSYTISVNSNIGIDYGFLSDVASGNYPFSASMRSDGSILVQSTASKITYSLPDFCSVISRGAYGYLTCDDYGPKEVAEGELNKVESSIDGLDGVYNDEPMQTGSYEETDSEARVRLMRESYTDKAFGTEKSIASHLVNDVKGVTYAVVKSNRGIVEDSDGRPPKSFEAVVIGGSDNDVAKCIFNNSCCGIESYGTKSVKVYDGNGDEQLVRFSRPQPVYLWIDISGAYCKDESFADDGVYNIKQEIVNWAKTEYSIGKDVISDRIKVPVYKVDGVGKISVKVGVTDSVTASKPTMSEDTIVLSSYKYAVVDESRIYITLT